MVTLSVKVLVLFVAPAVYPIVTELADPFELDPIITEFVTLKLDRLLPTATVPLPTDEAFGILLLIANLLFPTSAEKVTPCTTIFPSNVVEVAMLVGFPILDK